MGRGVQQTSRRYPARRPFQIAGSLIVWNEGFLGYVIWKKASERVGRVTSELSVRMELLVEKVERTNQFRP
jgi:hypothetical protein